MIQPCIIYAVVTIFLSWVDAMRIKYVYGKQPNINHTVSTQLAIWSGFGVYAWWVIKIPLTWWLAIAIILMVASFIGIRLVLFDIFLNLFRIWTGTNPTGRVDYESATTSSYIDNQSRPMPFWLKRAMGVAGFAVMFLLYKVIFKV